ncbi:TonB-dependent receptor plug domain-containing protein [Sunxiuqinia sp. A32]|uniref:TonB-dependent receptor plug domain-containing protein n=1 Tax=Sunxiuqinia sp. A32 TaxID=3461496 RepID=UPI0040455FC7
MFIFKHWGGKNYSLFQALKMHVKIGVLALTYFSTVLVNEVIAQTDSLNVNVEYDLDEIEVSAQRAPVSYSQVARIVSVINREQIESAPVGSIQDLLEYALSVDVRQRGTNGVQADVSIRGGSFDQTLILLNGINLSDPQTGHHNLNLPVSLKNIKRIEILEGPGARVYGPNAFSGAINIITDAGTGNSFTADVLFGEYQLQDINISGNVQKGQLNNYFAFDYKSSDGYIENTDFDNYNLFYHGNLSVEEGKLDFQAGVSNKEFGANSFYTPAYPNQFEATKTIFSSVKFESDTKLHLMPAVYWRRHQDRFELFRDNPASWYAGHNYHLTDVLGASINSWFSSDLGKTAFGAEFRSENIWSNVLGESLDKPIDVPGEEGKQFTKSHSRTSISYFAEHTFYVGDLTVSAGAMANWISDLNFEWNVYPGLDIAYDFTENWKVFASVNQSLRMPTFTDLYYDGPTNKGNPDLKPEESTTIEGGIKYRNQFIRSHVGYYHRKGKNLIDWVKESEEFEWTPQNLTEIITNGVEITSEIDFRKLVSKSFFLKKFNLNYSYAKLDKGESAYISNYVMDNLNHKLVLGIDHSIWKKLGANWKLRYQDRNGSYSRFEDKVYVDEAEYEPFWLVDAKLYWKAKNYQLYMNASNLFDKQYVDLGNVIQPGRWISFGFSYNLNLN